MILPPTTPNGRGRLTQSGGDLIVDIFFIGSVELKIANLDRRGSRTWFKIGEKTKM